MKKLFSVLLIIFFVSITAIVLADGPGPPPPPGDPSTSGGPVGAPIDGGLGILLVMGGVYGARKLIQARKEKQAGDKDEVTGP